MSGKVEFRWKVEDFASRKNETGFKKLASPAFYVGVQDEFHTQWQLEWFPAGEKPEFKDHMSLYLVLMRSNYSVVHATFEFWLTTKQGTELFKKKSNILEFHLLQDSLIRTHGWSSFATHATMRDNEVEEFTIHCSTDIKTMSGIHLENVALFPTTGMQDLYWKLYIDQEFTDLTIKTSDEDEGFKVHKVIMAAHSPVFTAMLSSDMMEKAKGCVKITDYEFAVVEKFIEFIYTGNCDVSESAPELLSMAEKYNVGSLKIECEIFLARNLTLETAAHSLLLADTQNAYVLMAAALDFIEKEDIRSLFGMESWQSVFGRPLLSRCLVNRLVGLIQLKEH